MKMYRWILGSAAAFLLLTPPGGVEACGPFFSPETFVRLTRPDDLKGFAHGELGILQQKFDSNELAVAYRYLNGGKLSVQELESYIEFSRKPFEDEGKVRGEGGMTTARFQAEWELHEQMSKDAQPAKQWLTQRALYAPTGETKEQTPAFPTDYNGLIEFDPSYLNCPDAAFINASATLKARSATWGKQSPWLKDWIYAQDAVFSSCGSKSDAIPAAAPAGAPTLLVADRAYQKAAAAFYGKQYDEAAREFEKIAADEHSPWQPWGAYLAARATVRKAFALGSKTTDLAIFDLATFDLATMRQAQHMLDAIRAKSSGPSQKAIDLERNFVRLRSEPEQRVNEICAALTGPAPDANFVQDLADLDFVLVKKLEGKNPPPLLRWIALWRTGKSAEAYTLWQQQHTLPWLVVALAKANPTDSFAKELVAEAAQIKPASPAYETVFYHRVRLLIGLKHDDEARTLLDARLHSLQSQKKTSTVNALRGKRMASARSFEEFLSFAPRTILAQDSENAGLRAELCQKEAKSSPAPHACSPHETLPGFDEDFLFLLNRKVPLNLWLEAAQKPSIPANLRQDLAVAGWVRAVLLEDSGAAAKFAPLLPKSLGVAPAQASGFAAVLTILRNSGLRPYLEPGVARVASFSQFSQYRNNWWDSRWEDPDAEEAQPFDRIAPTGFLTPAQIAAGESESKRLLASQNAAVALGQRVLDYAKAHPADANVPEALALTVRATHFATSFWSNQEPEAKASSAMSKAAFQLLHKRYPATRWAQKTKVYY